MHHTTWTLAILLCSCSIFASDVRTSEIVEPVIKQNPLPYQSQLDQRTLDQISMVVIHCTELPDLAIARDYGERVHYLQSGTGNSGHYYIDRDGTVEQYVSLDRVAHHVSGHNTGSIGIELVNTGRYPNWHHSEHQSVSEPYPDAQIEALIELLQQLTNQLPSLSWIAGHDELDLRMIEAEDNPDIQIRRKIDPGELFPWPHIMDNITLQRWQPAQSVTAAGND